MAVDLGGEFLKVSVVKPGRTPISIVTNEMSKRRTSAQLAFIEGDRLLGEEAAALAVRYPDRVYARRAAELNCSPLDTQIRAHAVPLWLLKACAVPMFHPLPQRLHHMQCTGLCQDALAQPLRTAHHCRPCRADLTHNCTSVVR